MNRKRRRFLLPPPRGERGGSGQAGVAAGDPRLDRIESGQAYGRQAVNLAILRALREHVAEHVRELRRFEGVHGKFARDRARSIHHVLRTLERMAHLPADPATDYQGDPGGGSHLAGGV